MDKQWDGRRTIVTGRSAKQNGIRTGQEINRPPPWQANWTKTRKMVGWDTRANQNNGRVWENRWRGSWRSRGNEQRYNRKGRGTEEQRAKNIGLRWEKEKEEESFKGGRKMRTRRSL